MSRDLLAMTLSTYAFLVLWYCFLRYIIHYQPRGKLPR